MGAMSLKEKVRLGVGILLLIYLVLFIIFNIDPLRVSFLFATVEMPIAFVVIFSAGLGAGVVWLLKLVRKDKA